MGASLRDDFLLAVAAGLVTGHSAVRKFGHNPAVGLTDEDIWVTGGTYAFPSDSGEALEIVSDNVADTSDVVLIMLDGNFNQKRVTVTLTGTTPVVLDGTWSRIQRGFVDDATATVGVVTVRPSGGGSTFAEIRAEEQQTSQTIYTVPAGKTGLILDMNYAVNKTGGATAKIDIFLRTKEFGKVFREREHTGIITNGTSSVDRPFKLPLNIPERTDVKMVTVSSVDGVDVSGGFNLITVDNEFLNA